MNYATDLTFAVDVPAGSYDVTLATGDMGIWSHDQMGVFLEGAQVDMISTLGGEVLSITYSGVKVSDGKLAVRMQDLGGNDANGVINGLLVEWASGDTFGPKVLDMSPAGEVKGLVDRMTFSFNEAIQAGSFTTADVASLIGRDGPIAPPAVNRLSPTEYEITFAQQSAAGAHSVTVGPDIADQSGNVMDQDGVGGEAIDDRFTGGFDLVAFAGRFDFGTSGSPVADGHTQVTPSSRYSSSVGYG